MPWFLPLIAAAASMASGQGQGGAPGGQVTVGGGKNNLGDLPPELEELLRRLRRGDRGQDNFLDFILGRGSR